MNIASENIIKVGRIKYFLLGETRCRGGFDRNFVRYESVNAAASAEREKPKDEESMVHVRKHPGFFGARNFYLHSSKNR